MLKILLITLLLIFGIGCSWDNGYEKIGKTELVMTFAYWPITCQGKTYWFQNVLVKRRYWWGLLTDTLRYTDVCYEDQK